MSNYMQALRQEIGYVHTTNNNTVSSSSDEWTNHDCYNSTDTIDTIDDCAFWSNDTDVNDIDDCVFFNI